MKIQREGDYGGQDYRICGEFQVGLTLKGPNQLTITSLSLEDLAYYEKKLTGEEFDLNEDLRQHFKSISEFWKYFQDDCGQFTFDSQTQELAIKGIKDGEEISIKTKLQKQNKLKYEVILTRLCRLNADIKRNYKSDVERNETLRAQISGLKLSESELSEQILKDSEEVYNRIHDALTSGSTASFSFNQSSSSSDSSYKKVLISLQSEISSLKSQIDESSSKFDSRFEEYNVKITSQNFNKFKQVDQKIAELNSKIERYTLEQSAQDKKFDTQISQIFERLKDFGQKLDSFDKCYCDIKGRIAVLDVQMKSVKESEKKIKADIMKDLFSKYQYSNKRFGEITKQICEINCGIVENTKSIQSINISIGVIQSLKVSVANTTTKIGKIDCKLRQFEGLFITFQQKDEQLKNQISINSEEISALTVSQTKLEQTLAKLGVSVSCCGDQVKGWGSKFKQLYLILENIQQTIKIIQNEEYSLKTTIGSIESKISNINATTNIYSSNYSVVEGTIRNIQNQIFNMENFQFTLSSKLDTIIGSLSSNSNTIQVIQNNYDSLVLQIGVISGQIQGLNSPKSACCQRGDIAKLITQQITSITAQMNLKIQQNTSSITQNTQLIDQYNLQIRKEISSQVNILTRAIQENKSTIKFNEDIRNLKTSIIDLKSSEDKFSLKIDQRLDQLSVSISEQKTFFDQFKTTDLTTFAEINTRVSCIQSAQKSIRSEITKQIQLNITEVKSIFQQSIAKSVCKCSCGGSASPSQSTNAKELQNLIKKEIDLVLKSKFDYEQNHRDIVSLVERSSRFQRSLSEEARLRERISADLNTKDLASQKRISEVEQSSRKCKMDIVTINSQLDSLTARDHMISDSIKQMATDISSLKDLQSSSSGKISGQCSGSSSIKKLEAPQQKKEQEGVAEQSSK